MKRTQKKVVVVIPIYKDMPSADERASLIQCLRVLNRYDVVIVTHLGIDGKAYSLIAEEYAKPIKFIYFDEHFFRGIQGYNELCLSADFYKSFREYEYMLIYQLDAWVFSDQLEYWCNKGYDYIGAPFFEHFGNHEEGNKLYSVGNGGLSLRRIESIIRVLTSWKPVYKKYSPKNNSPLRLFRAILFLCGYHNNMRSIIKNNTWYEDIFLCIELENTRMCLKRPSVDEACFFAFEQSPKYLFENKTKEKLPFGCHAFRKYEFDTFWYRYISI